MNPGTNPTVSRLVLAAALAVVSTATAFAASPTTAPSADAAREAAEVQHPSVPTPPQTGSQRTGAPDHSPAPAIPAAAPTSRPVNFNEAYGILQQRNIFRKDRTFIRPDSGISSRPPEIPLTPQQQWVLTGVTQDEGTKTYTAFLENVKTHDTTRHHTGESLAGGKIALITLNAIDYLPDGAAAPIHIDVGSNLEGHVPAALAGDAASTAPVEPGSTGAPAGSGGANDILERLRQKRLQELKK